MALYTIAADELATILAALRFYQGEGLGEPAKRSHAINDIACNQGEVISLDDTAIDALCERLNFGGVATDGAPCAYALRLTPAPGLFFPADHANGMQWDAAFSGLVATTEDEGDDDQVTAINIQGFTSLERVQWAADRWGVEGGKAQALELVPALTPGLRPALAAVLDRAEADLADYRFSADDYGSQEEADQAKWLANHHADAVRAWLKDQPAPTLDDQLRALIAEGLTFGEALNVFGAEQAAKRPELTPYAENASNAAAFVHACRDGDGSFNLDDMPIVSKGEDPGAYVMAWVWVTDEDAGVTRQEAEPAACEQCGCTDNDGSDICPDCGGAIVDPNAEENA